MTQVDGLQVGFATLACVEPVEIVLASEIGLRLGVIVAAIRTTQSLEEPFAIAAGADQPSGTSFLVKVCEVGFAATNRAIFASPLLLGNQADERFRLGG